MERCGSSCKIIFFIVILFPFTALCRTWKVTPGIPLQQTFDKAGNSDTVLISEGVYREKELHITKPLYIKGSGRAVLDGEQKYQILFVFASDVTIDGLHFMHGGRSNLHDLAGIKISRGRNVIIKNNFFYDMFFAVYFQECVRCTVMNNTVSSFSVTELQSGNGIHCWKCDSMLVAENVLSGNRDGIYFEFVTHSLIKKNTSSGNLRYGLHFMFSHNNIYAENKFERNGAGVAVMYTHHVTMKNNSFSFNWGSSSYGILLKEISDSEISDNQFTGNTAGIYMEGTNRITVKGNSFSNNGCAVRMQASCSGNTVTDNNFFGNTFDVTTNGSLVLNTINSNYWDKYEGYDLNRDGTGDIPFHPVSLYSMIIERMPAALIFMRSFLINLMDRTEKAIPSITPENFRDDTPLMKPLAL